MESPEQGSQSHFRRTTSSEERLTDLHLVIEPGFVHHRAIEARLTAEIRQEMNAQIARLPREPDFRFELQVDQLYSEAILLACRLSSAPTLGAWLAEPV